MQCPACSQQMEPVVFGEVTVARCTACHGICYDAMESDQLMALPGGATLDTDCIWDRNPEGESPLADTPGGFKGTNCPRCQTKMNPAWLRRKKNTHRGAIVFEKCGQCQGSYFDAGEFSDLAGA